MRVAIFDFDGTLYEKETFNMLMTHLKEHPNYILEYKQFYRAILPPYLGHKIKVYPTHKMRARSMQIYMEALDRKSTKELSVFFHEIAVKMRPDFNPLIIERFNQHRDDGVHLMLVSGAYTELLEQFRTEFPFDTLIGTDIPILNDEVNKTEQLEHIQGTKKNEKINDALRDESID